MSYITIYFPDGSHWTRWLPRGTTSFEYASHELAKMLRGVKTLPETRATIVLSSGFTEKMILKGKPLCWYRERNDMMVEH